MFSLRLAILVLAGLLAPGAAAQAPEPSPTPQATPTPAAMPAAQAPTSSVPAPPPSNAAAVAEAAGPAAPTCTLEEPCVRSDSQGFENGRYWFTGFVDMRAGEIRIQADRVEVEDQPGPKGASRILRAAGNVVFLKEDERLAGEKLELNLSSGKGTLDNASGFLEPGVFVEGRRIERLDADSYRIEGGRFTSCSQPNPRWSFTASWARVDLDKRIKAANVVFKIKQVPAFYFPYFVYPINSQGRATGILFPHIGYSSIKGFELGTGFFWAMNRSFDQTFYTDRYSRLGYGFGHEFRYQLGGVSNGSFRTYAIKPLAGGDLDYDINWNGVMALPSKVRASVAVRQFSNLLFQTQFQDSLNLATSRTRRVSANLQRTFFKGTQVRAYVDDTETFFGASTNVSNRLPGLSISRSSQRLGHTGVAFGYEARAERLVIGNQDEVSSYNRFDVAPQVSRPFSLPFLQFTPRLAYRFTRYSATLDGGQITGPALNRPYFETSIEMVGPQFSRVFNHEGGFYSEKFKHVISPEVTWTYRTRVEDSNLVPVIDGIDRFLGTNQFDYGLVQDFYAKRAGPGGKLSPYRFLTWTVRQTYYVNINESQNEFDPNYSTGTFGPGGEAHHTSPVQSRFRFRPTAQTSADFTFEYDVNFRQMRSLSVSSTLGGGWGSFTGGWARRLFARAGATELSVISNTLRGQANLHVLPQRLTLTGGVDYDAVKKSLLSSRVMARYDVQCCGFQVELLKYRLGTRDERVFRFAIELANIGSMGNFLGQDPGATSAYR